MSFNSLEEIKNRIELAYVRLESLKGDKSRVAGHERVMHEHDIKLLTQMLKEWKPK